jgi:hydrogenase maturation protease
LQPPILILGIGNILLRDEGVGVRTVQAIQKLELPAGVEVLDGGTSGCDLIEVIADRQKLIVIDAASVEDEPGSIYRCSDDDLLAQAGEVISLHELGLLDTLLMARQLGCAPREVVVYGIKPRDISPGLEMSDQISALVPAVVKLVLAEAAKTAVPATA